MPTATINGLIMHYRSRNDAGAGPLVFIHGGFGGMQTSLVPREWEWHTALHDAFRVIHHDRRSAGQSAYPDAFYTLDDLAQDVRALMDHLGVADAIIMGDSAGGPIAQTVALQYPDAVRALVLAETGPALGTAGAVFNETLRDRIRILRDEGAEAAYAARKADGDTGLAARPYQARIDPEFAAVMAPHMERLAELARRATEAAKQTTRAERVQWYAGELRNYAAYVDVDLTPRLPDITAPTLVIHGTRDRLVPFSYGETLARAIPNARMAAIEKGDHGIMMFPGAVDALREFMNDYV